MRSGFKGSSCERFNFVKRLRGRRYKDYSALRKCPSKKPWGECMRMVPIWRHIVVLAVGLLQEFNDWVFIVNECGYNTEHYKLSDFETVIECTSALLGLHAFTGNDYVLSFFKKGKEKCWKIMRKSQKVENTFGKLDKELVNLTDELFSHLEEFICKLYGYKEKNINKA